VPTCRVCGSAFPNRIRVDGTTRVLNRRKACLSCVPFKAGYRVESVERPAYDSCVLCDKPCTKRLCGSCRTKIRRYRAKAAAIKLLGGVCCACGWEGPQAGFEFHYLGNKEFNFGNVSNKSWKVIVKELRKCQLLCSRCHRISHSTREDAALIAEAERYNGSLLDFGS
jgi:hypothetical protein